MGEKKFLKCFHLLADLSIILFISYFVNVCVNYFLYLWINYPSFQKELEVIQLKVPQIGYALAVQATSFVQALRREKLNKVPGLSEAIDWVKALQSTGVRVLDRAAVENLIGCLLKDRQDITAFKETMVVSLLEKVDIGARSIMPESRTT